MEEYLTTDELCERIKYQKQTIYNLIHRRILVAGKHFLKPTPKKILFKWSEIQTWIGESPGSEEGAIQATAIREHPTSDMAGSIERKRISVIRI
jgi:hypothetical protein